MALKDIPVLPENYPLFDWEDWPRSYAALVPGGPTRAFEKECWNAIVDTIVEAFTAAGFEWRNGKTDPETIKMYGNGIQRLTAENMNHLISGINNVVNIPWKWGYDETFRGYIGREGFYKSSDEHQDVVYPEYFLELVRHINMVIEIMRGTSKTDIQSANLCTRSQSIYSMAINRSATANIKNILAGTRFNSEYGILSAGELREFPKHESYSTIISPKWISGAILYTYNKEMTNIVASGSVRRTAAMENKIGIGTKQLISLTYRGNVVELAMQRLSKMHSTVSTQKSYPISFFAKSKTESIAEVKADQKESQQTSALVGSKSQFIKPETGQILDIETPNASVKSIFRCYAEGSIASRKPISETVSSISTSKTDVLSEKASQTNTEKASKSIESTKVVTGITSNISEHAKQRISVVAPILKYRTGPIFAEGDLYANVFCGLDVLSWLYPVRVNGGLLIRQAYSVNQYDNGELEVR